MKRPLYFKLAAILIVVIAAAVYTWPPFNTGDREGTINLGLDLQGGMHLVLEVQTDEAVENEVGVVLRKALQDQLSEAGVSGAEVGTSDLSTLTVRVGSEQDLEKVEQVVDEDFPILEDAGGLDDGAIGTTYALDSDRVRQIRDEAVNQALETIRRRVDELGVSEPIIQRQGLGGNRILVQLPGIDDPERALDIIGRVAKLEFRLVQDFGSDRAALQAKYAGQLGTQYQILPAVPPKGSDLTAPPSGFYVVHSEAPITGADLETARVGQDQHGLPAVDFMLDPEGGRRIRDFSSKHVGEQLAVVLEGKVETAPVIQSALGSRSQITGSFSTREAQDLALVLRAGALPASIQFLENRTVGPSLGRDSIDQGINSIIIGGLLVVLAMFVIYKASGIAANIALLVNLVLIAGALAALGATLTLPGIAGVILTIGMAVDANILIFERIKEELATGKTVRTAVKNGFDRAFWTIMDANVTTLIAGFVLLQFGTGPVRGFAVTLCIGIVATLFAALVVSRMLFDLVLARFTPRRLSI